MAEVDEWVVYEPPKSVSFGHQSRVRDPRRAWRITEEFLTRLTLFDLGHRVELTCHAPDVGFDAAVVMARIQEARHLFGPEENTTETHPRWKLSGSQLAAAIQFALDNDKYPKQKTAPARLHFYYTFRWARFEDLPWTSIDNQIDDRKSNLGITIGYKGLFLQPAFVFPAPFHSEYLKNFIAEIEPVTPFRFRDQYFKRSLPMKRGRGRRGRFLRLDRGWRRAPHGVHVD